MNVLNAAIYSKLQSTSAITNLLAGTVSIYHMQAPENAEYPYIVYSQQAGGDENLSQHRVKNTVRFIRAYATGSQGAALAGSIDAQVDAALHLSPLTVSGWTNLWLARETDLEGVENTPSGQQVHMAGGFYRLLVEKE